MQVARNLPGLVAGPRLRDSRRRQADGLAGDVAGIIGAIRPERTAAEAPDS